MKKINRAVILAAAVFTAAGAFSAAAADDEGPGKYLNKTGNEGNSAESVENVFSVKDMRAAQEAQKLVLVVGQGGSKIEVSYYKKDDGENWNQVFETEGVYGRNGGTWDKKEGDGMTPYGTYGINKAFGILDNPGSILPYTKLTENDYWVDDSGSGHYNRMVNTTQTAVDWNSAEHLVKVAPYYNYVLSLDYNEEAVPGKGSAIFVHCTEEGYTGSSGCICIGEEEMKTLVMEADDTMKTVIVPSEDALKEQ